MSENKLIPTVQIATGKKFVNERGIVALQFHAVFQMPDAAKRHEGNRQMRTNAAGFKVKNGPCLEIVFVDTKGFPPPATGAQPETPAVVVK